MKYHVTYLSVLIGGIMIGIAGTTVKAQSFQGPAAGKSSPVLKT